MPNFNRKRFFDGFKQEFDPTLEQSQVEGIEFLLKSFEADDRWTDIRHIAYALATVYHETAGSMQPVEEGYYLGSKTKVKAFQKTLRYYPHYGRGYVQLTWPANYAKAAKELGVPLDKKPELALEPETAFRIMTLGMFQGWFTGKKLADYINVDHTDYTNARKIINRLDKAGLIAGYARKFEKLLRDSAAAPLPTTEDQGENQTNSASESSAQGQPPIKTVVEQTQTETRKDGDLTESKQTTVTADSNVAVEKEEHPGFLASIWKKLTGAVVAVGGFNAVTDGAKQAQVFGLSAQFWQSVFIIVAIGVAIWLLIEAFKWFFGVWMKRKRTEKLAEINSTPSNVVLIVPSDQLEKYEQDKNWVVIRRS
jgi:hypothetical protein